MSITIHVEAGYQLFGIRLTELALPIWVRSSEDRQELRRVDGAAIICVERMERPAEIKPISLGSVERGGDELLLPRGRVRL